MRTKIVVSSGCRKRKLETNQFLNESRLSKCSVGKSKTMGDLEIVKCRANGAISNLRFDVWKLIARLDSNCQKKVSCVAIQLIYGLRLDEFLLRTVVLNAEEGSTDKIHKNVFESVAVKNRAKYGVRLNEIRKRDKHNEPIFPQTSWMHNLDGSLTVFPVILGTRDAVILMINQSIRVKTNLKREKEIMHHGQISFILDDIRLRKALLIRKSGSPKRKKRQLYD